MSDRSGNDHTYFREGGRRHSRRTFVSHAAPAAAAAAAALGIAVAVDDDAPERLRLTVLPGGGLVYNVRHYGAQGDGQTDDAAAIQKAINAAKNAGGGTIYVPQGTYAVGSPLMYGEKWGGGIKFVGDGCAHGAGHSPSRLLYKGASGSLLRLYSVSSWQLEDLGFWYDNPAFKGDLIDVDGAPFHSDCQTWGINRCSTAAKLPSGAPFSARSMIRLNQAIYGSIEHCHITGSAGNGIRVGDPGGHYVNAVQIEKCTFNHNLDAHILLGTADGENIVIRDCGFEATGGPNDTAIKGGRDASGDLNNQLYSPLIEGCWCGDSYASTIWIDGLRIAAYAFPGTIRACMFGDAKGGKHLYILGPWLVEGCTFQHGHVYNTLNVLDSLHLTALANNYIMQAGNTSDVIFGSPYDSVHPVPFGLVSLGNRLGTSGNATPDSRNVAAAANRVPALAS